MLWKYQSTKHNYIRLLFEFENITHLSSWIYEDTAMIIKGKYKNKQQQQNMPEFLLNLKDKTGHLETKNLLYNSHRRISTSSAFYSALL